MPFAERDELIARLSTSIAGGEPPDLFLMNYRYYGQFAARGALEPVGPYLAGSDAFSAEDFFDTAMTPFRWDGEQMCLPQNVSSLVVYYNADLFEAADVALPTEGWTWDDMVSTAEKLTRDDDGDGTTDVYGLGVDPEIIRIAPFIWSNGGTLVDDETAPTQFALDANAVVAMQRFFDLRTVQGVTPTDEEAEAEDLESRFINGRLAMLMESRRVVPTFRTIDSFAWDVAGLPSLGSPVSILHSDAYCMTAGGDDKDAAWRFMEFALGPEGQRIASGDGAHGAVAAFGREQRRLPRSGCPSRSCPGVPGSDPWAPGGPRHLHVAGDRGHRERVDRGGVLRRRAGLGGRRGADDPDQGSVRSR